MALVLHEDVIAEVAKGEDYGLKYPVRVRLLENGPQGMMGKYHGLGRYGPTTEEPLAEPAHHISLAADIGEYTGNVALLHEMTHAKQCERFLPEDVEGDEATRTANRELGKAFRQEMKEIRRKKGTTSKAMTMDYATVSFEREAGESKELEKKYKLVSGDGNEDNDLMALLDDKGRFTYRIDLWKNGKYDTKAKRYVDGDFRGTYYVLAKTEWDAKSFAKKEWGDTSDDAKAYLRPPFPPKKGGE